MADVKSDRRQALDLALVVIECRRDQPGQRCSCEQTNRDLATMVEKGEFARGAGRFETVRRVVLPAILPAVVTGFALSFRLREGSPGFVPFRMRSTYMAERW